MQRIVHPNATPHSSAVQFRYPKGESFKKTTLSPQGLHGGKERGILKGERIARNSA